MDTKLFTINVHEPINEHVNGNGMNEMVSFIHQSPFGGVNQWGMLVVTLAFTPSPYILL